MGSVLKVRALGFNQTLSAAFLSGPKLQLRLTHLIVFGPTWIILPDRSGWKCIQSDSSEQQFMS